MYIHVHVDVYLHVCHVQLDLAVPFQSSVASLIFRKSSLELSYALSNFSFLKWHYFTTAHMQLHYTKLCNSFYVRNGNHATKVYA